MRECKWSFFPISSAPFAALLEPTLQRIHERFPQDVVLVFRSFPLDDVHPRAFTAAEAAGVRRGAREILGIP